MFGLDQETQNFWINPNAIEGVAEFKMVGQIIGLAMYNGVIVDIHFPAVFYKKLHSTEGSAGGFQVGLLSVHQQLYLQHLFGSTQLKP